MLADLVGRDDEQLVLDRAGAQQRLPVGGGRGVGEGGGDRDQLRALDGEHAVELREAHVVADRQARPACRRRAGTSTISLAGSGDRRLAVDAPADLDVEHVDLAVGARTSPRPSISRLVLRTAPSAPRSSTEPAKRSIPSSRGERARERHRGPVAVGDGSELLLICAERRPLLGQYDELGAARGGLPHEPVGGREVRARRRSRRSAGRPRRASFSFRPPYVRADWETIPAAPLSLRRPAAQRRDQQLGVHRADQLAQRIGAGLHDLQRALDVDLAGEPLEQRADLLLDERFERLAVAQRVVDGEPERLVVAAGAEARDRLDDLDVVGARSRPRPAKARRSPRGARARSPAPRSALRPAGARRAPRRRRWRASAR